MNKRTEKTISGFRAGLNCAQAVLTAYSDELNLDQDIAINISSGFGAGMGRLQETCGAVTGSYMVLGIYNGNKYSDNKVKKEVTYSMIQKFTADFKEMNTFSDCKSLLNCDLKTESGQLFAKENNLFGTICEKCIIDSISILDKLVVK
jgi:C_GCAxxG_C_C family probable redox protein